MPLCSNRLLLFTKHRKLSDILYEHVALSGYQFVQAADNEKFWLYYCTLMPTVIVFDFTTKGSECLEIMRHISHEVNKSAIILIYDKNNTSVDVELVARDLNLQVVAIFENPIELELFRSTLNSIHKGRYLITADAIETSLGAGQFCLHYQPKAALSGERSLSFAGVEALARWDHPSHGVIPPSEFIPAVEEAGLDARFTDEMIRLAIEQMAVWQQQGLKLSVSVNIPPSILKFASLPYLICGQLDAAGIPPTSLTLELTGNICLTKDSRAQKVLAELQASGLKISLDATGAGDLHANLLGLPINELKLQSSLLAQLETNPRTSVVIKSIIDLAKELGLTTCAVGVETQDTLGRLTAWGCDFVQGYHVSPPLPANELAAFMNRTAVSNRSEVTPDGGMPIPSDAAVSRPSNCFFDRPS